MDRLIEFPHRDSIETEACAWISQLDGDCPPSAADIAALKEWLNRSPVHRQELQRAAQLWGDLNQLTELAPALQSLESPKPSLYNSLVAPLMAPRLTLASCFTAAMLALAGVMLWANLGQIEPSHQLYSSQIGEQQLATLPDGSVLQLNTNSQVEIDFSADRRKVRLLQGEAHFQVAHNKTRPFEVYAGQGRVRALGTAFSVYLKEQAVEVTVTEGRVELASGLESLASDTTSSAPAASDQQRVELRAGQITSYHQQVEPVRTLRQDEVARKLSWREGMLVFSGESLEQVVQQVSRYTTQTIVISDPAIRDMRIGGYFKAGETQAMLDVLESNFGVRVERIHTGLVKLSRASRPQ